LGAWGLLRSFRYCKIQGVKLYTLDAKIAICGYFKMMQKISFLGAAFGQVLRAHREKAGLTQKELAAKMDASLSTVKKLEHGDHIPSLQTVLILCRGLDVEPRDFVAEVTHRLAFLEGRKEG
jgi:DNA-binding XRE family transcriptional regulator